LKLTPCYYYGAEARNRTEMDVSPEDFESKKGFAKKPMVSGILLILLAFSF